MSEGTCEIKRGVMLTMYDVIIIGAGQAGLSMGYYLKKTNLSFLVLDKEQGLERFGKIDMILLNYLHHISIVHYQA